MATERTHNEFLEMVWVHAVGALDGPDLREFEGHLAGCKDCQAELVKAVQTVDRLPYAVKPQSPPVGLAEKVERRIAAVAASSAKTPTTRITPISIIGYATAAVFLIAAIFGWQKVGEVNRQFDELQSRLRTIENELSQGRSELALYRSPNVSILFLAGQADAVQASGRVVWDTASGSGLFLASNLPALPPDKTYQLWVITDGKPVSAGVFGVTASGTGEIALRGIPAKDSIGAFAVTIEPAGGLPQPSGAMYLVGALTKS